MADRQNGEGQSDRVVDRTPLLDGVEGQAVPVQAVFNFGAGQSLRAQLLSGLFKPAACALQQEFAGQAAGDVDEHGPNREPGQDRVEVDTGMHENQERSRPGHAFVQPEKRCRIARRDELPFAQGVAEGPDDQQHAGNAEVASDPDGVQPVQKRVDCQCGEAEQREPEEERDYFAGEEGDSHGYHASSTSADAGMPTHNRQAPVDTSKSGLLP